jgi:hypothetical protein
LRRDDSRLVAGGAAGGPNARSDQLEARPERRPKRGSFLRRAHDAVETAVRGEAREAQHLSRRVVGDAGGLEIVIVEAREHGHGNQQRGRRCTGLRRFVDRVTRGGQHRGAARRVDIHHPDAEPGRRGTRAGDGIRNVVKLEIEKDAEATGDHRAHRLVPPETKSSLPTLSAQAAGSSRSARASAARGSGNRARRSRAEGSRSLRA